jgi:VIT1/CCC1 family predicted Fe2+/Mn2+ transporter
VAVVTGAAFHARRPDPRRYRRFIMGQGNAEFHRSGRTGWLRAAVLGANDGLLSVASLMMGVGAASDSRGPLLVAGFAALAAGALSMAAGEYGSVSSQRDAELADLAKEQRELEVTPEEELAELAAIYRGRGLSAALAQQVAVELTADHALEHHARDELGLDLDNLAKPVEAAVVSASSFAVGGLVPVVIAMLIAGAARQWGIVIGALAGLTLLGAVGARLGGAPMLRAALRMVLLGGLAMAVTTIVGHLVGGAVG